MKRFLPILSLFILGTFSSHAWQQEGVTVVGKATIEKAPDQFTVVFTIEQQGRSVAKLKANVDHKVTLLTTAVKGMKVADKDITTTNLQIYPIYPQRNNRVNRAYIEGGRDNSTIFSVTPDAKSEDNLAMEFQLKRTVKVNLFNVDQYELLLDKAVKIGVNRISPVQTSFSNAEKLYQQALLEALSNAQNKGQQLAKKLGAELGQVITISEQAYRAPGPVLMAAESSDAIMSRTNYSGVNQISAEVTVTFAIKQ